MGNLGPGTSPTPNHGNQAAALMSIHSGLKSLVMALNDTPMGTPLYTDLIQCVQKLNKVIGDSQPDQGLQAQHSLQAMRQQQQNAPQIAAMRAMSQPNQPPAIPGPPPDQQAA